MDKKTVSLFSFFLLFLTAISILTLPTVIASPRCEDEAINIANNTEYNPNRDGIASYGFQATCQDSHIAHNISAVYFWNDFNGTAFNFTGATNSTSTIYYVNFSFINNISAANTTYNYRWFVINGSTDYDNSTAATTYYIARNTTTPVTSNMTVYAIGGTASTITSGDASSFQGQGNPYADCWMGHAAGQDNVLWGTTSLYRDGVAWTKGSTGATSLAVADYTVKCNSTGNVNYTSNATGHSYTLHVLASGSGGGGGGGVIYNGETTTQPSWTWTPQEDGWQLPEMDQTTIIILVIIGIVILSSRKKK